MPVLQHIEMPVNGVDMYNCHSKYWKNVFSIIPEFSFLEVHNIASKDQFRFLTVYKFCSDVVNGDYEFFGYEYQPGVYWTESPACFGTPEIMKYSMELKDETTLYLFLLNFNDWLQALNDSYKT